MAANPSDELHLKPFARRIRLLRCWRCAAMGGSAGALVAIVMATLDFFRVHYFVSWTLAIPVAAGIMAGILKALCERLPGQWVARSVDRRANLNDRLTTALEVPDGGGFSSALHIDAASQAAPLRPAALYPIRAGRWHGILLLLATISAVIFLLGNTTFLKSAQAKHDAADLKQAGIEVERVAKPVLEDAKHEDADKVEKDLAHRLEAFTGELKKARMSRPEALVKANELAEEAKKIQATRATALAGAIQSAQTAAGEMSKMAEKAGLEKSDAMKLAEQAAATQREIDTLEQKIASQQTAKPGQSGKSSKERAALEKKLAELKNKLKAIQLSRQAQEMLDKLHAMPEFKEAQELLAKLASNASMQQAGNPSEMTAEQMEAAAKQLEELAKQLNTDAKMKEYAKRLLEAAKRARLAKNGQLGAGLLGAFGLGPGMGGVSNGLNSGAGSPSEDHWIGAHGKLNMSDKSSLLNAKLDDRIVTSQQGKDGPSTYTEVIGPSSPTGKSSVPYQTVLPKYEKSAESALNKGDIPPAMRGKVRDYFDSLRK